MDPKDLEKLWSDPRNYKNGVYSCKEDPRVVVPKRVKWAGWTLNFAHRQAWWVLVSFFLWIFIPVGFALFIWPKTDLGLVVSLILGGVGVVIYCIWMQKRIK